MEGLISIEHILAGLEALLSAKGLLFTTFGVILGIAIGATPGLSPSMGVALLVPFSFGMEPTFAFIFFVAVYQAANYGGSITAIALNAPGTPASVVTAIDGYALTSKGAPGRALGVAVLSSAIGGVVGAIILMLCAIPIASIGLKFGPAEYFSLAFFGLTTVVAFGKNKWAKASVGILLGLLLSTVGTDPFSGADRFTFGVIDLFDGFIFIPSMIGLFALSEIFHQIEKGAASGPVRVDGFSGKLPKLREVGEISGTIGRSSLFGTFIGVIPGAGATIASLISYGQSKRFAKKPEEYGEGSIEGIAASESANSSSVGGALVPLLALGIPGSATDAVLLGALSLHGLVAGPELFRTEPALVYGIFSSLFLANLLILVFGLVGNRIWLRVIGVPKQLLYPIVIAMCVIGSYTVRNAVFDAWVCVGFGIGGWWLKRHGYQPAPIVLGLVLGKLLEMNFRRTLLLGGPELFFTKPISAVLLTLALLSLAAPIVQAFRGPK